MPGSDGGVEEKVPVPGLGRAWTGDKSNVLGMIPGSPDHLQ